MRIIDTVATMRLHPLFGRDEDDNNDGTDDLDGADLLGGDDNAGDDDNDEGDTDGADGEQPLTLQQVESLLDTRLSGLVREIRGTKRGSGHSTQQRRQQTAQPTGPSPADLREARASYRDAMTDFRFVDQAEREVAMTLATQSIHRRLRDGDDVEQAGSAAAREAADAIKNLRSVYQAQILKSLRAKGHLVEDGSGRTTTSRARQGTASSDAGFKSSADIAASLYKDRLPADKK